ncbi:hypothetical protein P346_01662 [Enterobacter sp. DC1]|uniref:ead/Ea22-like family protein n=1 Tax=Enterobacter sp. DC1 TaxID=314330 RepID=UPI0003ED0157|nr:ead/Ea22-like family protein [Enterobacter sp. DC1]EWG70480.1 hypothetical protein P346_01662 [Enterobacter sp. DC1]
MSNIDIQALRERYSEKPAPKCHICGSVMTIQRAGAGSVVYGCTGRIDGDGEGYKFEAGRDFADDHYARSRVTEYGPGGDPDVLALLDELEAKDKRIAELEVREVKPVAWMRNANVTSFMSRFTTDEKYAVEQWGDDAVALYPLPVDFIPACFTDERNLMHINERGRETSLIWSKQNSDSGDIKLFRIASAAGKGE